MKYRLEDLINISQFQALQDKLNAIYPFPSAIIDNDGKILTATAWQEICTNFHRKHPECEKECIKSDKYILEHLSQANPAVTYKCPHGLVDNALPIIIDGIHYGNFFTGQFFLDTPNLQFFNDQAVKYGFDVDSYLEAVKKVPVWKMEQLESYLYVIKGLIEMISSIGLESLKEFESRKVLEENEQKFRSLFENSADGKTITGLDGSLIEVNDAFCRIVGFSRDELLSKNFNDITHPDDRQKGMDLILLAIQGRKDPLRFEKRYIHKEGKIVWVEVISQIQRDSDGKPQYLITSVINITERKLADVSLRNQQKDLTALFSISQTLATTLDLPLVLQKIIDMATELAELDTGAIYNIKGSELYLEATKPPLPNDIPDIFRKASLEQHPHIKEAISTGLPVILPDMRTAKLTSAELVIAETRKLRSVIFIPIFIEKRAIGILIIGTNGNRVKQFTENEINLYRTFSTQAALAIENARLMKSTQNAESYFRALIENGSDLITLVDVTGEIKYESPSVFSLLGYSPLELKGKLIYNYVHSSDKAKLIKFLQDDLCSNEPAVKIEIRLSHKNKKWRFFEITGKNLLADPNVNAIVLNCRDVTERKEAELELLILKQSIDTASEGAYWMDLDGNFIYINDAGCKMLGYAKDELMKLKIFDINPLATPDRWQDVMNIVKQKGSINVESVLKRKDGSEFPVELSSTYFKFGGKEYCNGFAKDITERKLFEKALKEKNDELDNYFNSSLDLLCIANSNGEFIKLNPEWERILGYPIAELEGKKFSDFVHQEDLEKTYGAMALLEGEEDVLNFENRYLCKDGTYKWIEWRAKSKGPSIYAVARDVTKRKNAEIALKISRERFEQVANSAGIWVWEVDANGIYTYVSPMEETILGYKIEEIVGKKYFYDFFAPEIKEELKDKAFQVFAERGSFINLENANVHKDGHIVILETSGIPIIDENGNLLGYRGADRDITVQKYAIEKLGERESQFRTLVENSPNLIVRFDEQLRHIFVNRAVEEASGKPYQYFMNKTFRDLQSLPHEQIEFSENILKSVFESKEPVSFETSLNGPRGLVKLVSKAVPEFDEFGNVKSVLVLHHDITDRIKAESAKEAAENKYKAMFSEMNNGCALNEIILDDMGSCIDYVTIEVNAQFEKLLGAKRKDVLGKKASEMLPADELKKWINIFAPVAVNGISITYEMYSPLNKKYFEGVAYCPAKNQFAVVFSDVTERKKIESDLEKYRNNLEELVKERTRQLDALNTTLIYEIERKNEAERLLKDSLEKEKELNTLKSRFINTASHEFKTPLTSVLSSVELMQRYGFKWPEEKKAVHLDRIKSSVEYLNGLINDVLYVSRSESGKIVLNPEPTDLNELCRKVIDEARLYGSDKHEFIFKPFKENKEFNLDQKQIYIILQNLISNATKYSPDGGKIELKTGIDSKKIKITVKDQGVGIAEEELPKLFEPFHRIGTVRDVSGTGLGLVIIKNAVDMHKGVISVKSQLGKGSTFTIEIPINPQV